MPGTYADAFAHTPESLREAENALFVEWQKAISPPPFLRDGAAPSYARAAHRLLFVLKEGNDEEGAWAQSPDGDIRLAYTWDCTDRHARPTWRPITRWASYVLDRVDPQAITQDIWRAVLSRIAVVNVKKRPGGSVASAAEILGRVRDHPYAQLLYQQLSFYRPHITICGGDLVGQSIGELMGWPEDSWRRLRCSRTGGNDPDEIWYKEQTELGRRMYVVQ